MKVCPACGKINLDEALFCDKCAESLARVQSIGVGEAVEAEKRIELQHKAKPKRVGSRAPVLVALGIGLTPLISGLYLFFVLENLIGIFLMFAAFWFLGVTTQWFKDVSTKGRRYWAFQGQPGYELPKARRQEEDEERRHETVDN